MAANAEDDHISLPRYCFQQLRNSQNSIFFSSLAAGLFLDYLQDGEANCSVFSYANFLFAIGVSHYVIVGLGALLLYAAKLRAVYTARFATILRSILIRTQYIMYIILGVYVFYIIQQRSAGRLVIYMDDPCLREQLPADGNPLTIDRGCQYCNITTINLGQLIFFFHLFYGLVTVCFWCRMWSLLRRSKATAAAPPSRPDVRDSGEEQSPQAGWCRRIVDAVSMDPLFIEEVVGTMLTMSVVVPDESCSASLLAWYMVGGVFFLVSGLMDGFIAALVEKVEIALPGVSGIQGSIDRSEKHIPFPRLTPKITFSPFRNRAITPRALFCLYCCTLYIQFTLLPQFSLHLCFSFTFPLFPCSCLPPQ